MAIIINIIDEADSVRKDFTVASVTFSDSFKCHYLGDGVHELLVNCDYTTPTPSPTPSATPSPTSTPPPSFTPGNTPTPTPTITIVPSGYYCVRIDNYGAEDCSGSYDTDYQCMQGIEVDWDNLGVCVHVGDSNIVMTVQGGPYDSAIDCESYCVATPTPTPTHTQTVPCCGPSFDEGPFDSESAADEYAQSHSRITIACEEMGEDCRCGEGCGYYASNISKHSDGWWYVEYICDIPDCYPCTPTPTPTASSTPTTPVPSTTPQQTLEYTMTPWWSYTPGHTPEITPGHTPDHTVVPPPLWYCYKYDSEASVMPTPTHTPSVESHCYCGGPPGEVYCAATFGEFTQEQAEAWGISHPTVSIECGGGYEPFCDGSQCILGYSSVQYDPVSNSWMVLYCDVIAASNNCTVVERS